MAVGGLVILYSPGLLQKSLFSPFFSFFESATRIRNVTRNETKFFQPLLFFTLFNFLTFFVRRSQNKILFLNSSGHTFPSRYCNVDDGSNIMTNISLGILLGDQNKILRLDEACEKMFSSSSPLLLLLPGGALACFSTHTPHTEP